MLAVNYSTIRENLKSYCDKVTDNNETVMFAPAQGFYGTEGLGKDELRIAYVLKCEDMVRGAQLIAGGLEAYKNR